MTSYTNPEFPAGEFTEVEFSAGKKTELIGMLAQAPGALRKAVNGLSDHQLETKYRNWTIRQIVHHIADSHVNSYIRFKWALTEPTPTIKAYQEADWVELADSRRGDIAPSVQLLEGLHVKWVQLLKLMTDEQFQRSFVHPQTGETVSLWSALNYYPWHCRHHTAQILLIIDGK